MKIYCVNKQCLGHYLPEIRPVKNGYFYRKSDTSYVPKYKCTLCAKNFSAATFSAFYWQKRRDLDLIVLVEMASSTSQRRLAELFDMSKNTVPAKIGFFYELCLIAHEDMMMQVKNMGYPLSIQMDEMETFEHTKMKPVSIPLIVDTSRLVLGVDACSMPAKGRLAKKSRKKYGLRVDERAKCLEELVSKVANDFPEVISIESDQCPRYPKVIQKYYPEIKHYTYKGRRGCVVGQGELKAGGYDPLFALNHTAAMFRDNIKTLARRTWCTTKKIEKLKQLLVIYGFVHNCRLVEKLKLDGHILGSINISYNFRRM